MKPPISALDAARYAAGRRLASANTEVEDLAIAEYRHDGGALVRLTCSWRANSGDDAIIRADIHGSQAGATWRNVNGSFFDFTIDRCRGTQRERLGTYPDDWSARALTQWLGQLSRGQRFDPHAWELLAAASALEEACLR